MSAQASCVGRSVVEGVDRDAKERSSCGAWSGVVPVSWGE